MKTNYIIIVIIIAAALLCFNLFFKSKPIETKKIEYKRGETKIELKQGETVKKEEWISGKAEPGKETLKPPTEAIKIDTMKFFDDNLKLSVILKQDSAGITVTPSWEVLAKTFKRVDTITSERVDTLNTTITLEAPTPFYSTGWFRVLEICVAIIATILLIN